MAAEFRNSGEYEFVFVLDPKYNSEDSVFSNIPKLFNTVYPVDIPSIGSVRRIINQYKPTHVITRCWTAFSQINIPESIYWKVESNVAASNGLVEPILPTTRHKAVWVQRKCEVGEYRNRTGLPTGYFPRGVSHNWEKPLPKTMDIMVTGTCSPKLASYKMLTELLCTSFSPNQLFIFGIHGQEALTWAEDFIQPQYLAEEAPIKYAQARIFVCPVASTCTVDLFSHKTLQTMACRTLTIMPKYTNVESFLGRDGENLVYANSSEECLDKVKFYLKHEKEREAIAERGYKFIHSEYNYTKLLKRALNEIGAE